MTDWAPSPGELIAERFELQHELARGGMGAIWKAHHIRLDCPCVVKFIDEQYVREDFLRERFEREARAAARLRSRHVVQMLDYGVWHGMPYIAMELLEGESLAERLERTEALSAGETLSIVKGVARALDKAAALGIVHRDLKPENIFIVDEGGSKYAKVLDFGVAKLKDPHLITRPNHTDTGIVVGTPYYMSPEQADGTIEVDHRSDLWSLAVIVYECLTGELPFYSEAFGNLVLQITTNPIPLPCEVAPHLPPELDNWWVKAASRIPDERFQSGEELHQALDMALAAASPSDNPRAALSEWPARMSWMTPRSARSCPVALPSDIDEPFLPSASERPGPLSSTSSIGSDQPLSSQNIGWSGPYSPTRPHDRGALPVSGGFGPPAQVEHVIDPSMARTWPKTPVSSKPSPTPAEGSAGVAWPDALAPHPGRQVSTLGGQANSHRPLGARRASSGKRWALVIATASCLLALFAGGLWVLLSGPTGGALDLEAPAQPSGVPIIVLDPSPSAAEVEPPELEPTAAVDAAAPDAAVEPAATADPTETPSVQPPSVSDLRLRPLEPAVRRKP